MKKIISIIVLVIIIVGVAYLYVNYSTSPKEESKVNQVDTRVDTTANINRAIENIDLGDLDKEFQVIDSELESL